MLYLLNMLLSDYMYVHVTSWVFSVSFVIFRLYLGRFKIQTLLAIDVLWKDCSWSSHSTWTQKDRTVRERF